jgi:hypothetical protein
MVKYEMLSVIVSARVRSSIATVYVESPNLTPEWRSLDVACRMKQMQPRPTKCQQRSFSDQGAIAIEE